MFLPITLFTLLASSVLSLPTVSSPAAQQCSIFDDLSRVNCFEGPGSQYTAIAEVEGGHYYSCKCYSPGEDVNGNANWDFIPDSKLDGGGCYVPQFYTTDPCGNSTLPKC